MYQKTRVSISFCRSIIDDFRLIYGSSDNMFLKNGNQFLNWPMKQNSKICFLETTHSTGEVRKNDVIFCCVINDVQIFGFN